MSGSATPAGIGVGKGDKSVWGLLAWRCRWTPQGQFQAAGSWMVGLEPRSAVQAADGQHLRALMVVEVKTAGVEGLRGGRA